MDNAVSLCMIMAFVLSPLILLSFSFYDRPEFLLICAFRERKCAELAITDVVAGTRQFLYARFLYPGRTKSHSIVTVGRT